MNRDNQIITRFSSEKLTDTQYRIVERWDKAFLDWFEGNRKEHCWGRIVIFTDDHVWDIYKEKITASLKSLQRPLVPLVLPMGEDSKDFNVLPGLVETLLRNRVHRRDLIVCAGGGVCCDLGGMLAMLYMRGIDYVNVPTSLIAQIDAAIGGKVGSNFGIHKNLLGGFHHPLQVFIDISFLDTLPEIYFKSALAEAFKVAIIRENHDTLLELMEKQPGALLKRRKKALLELLEQCLRGKLELLADDPYERCLDRSLNLGHAVAHALERLPVMANLRKPLHGEAVAVGLAAGIRFAFRQGLCSRNRAVRLLEILKALDLPVKPDHVNPQLVKSQLGLISDQRGGLIRLVVPVDQGGVEILPRADVDVLIQCLEPIAGLPM